MKRIFKYPTGGEVPEGSIFLSTIVQELKGVIDMSKVENCRSHERLVWHYFLVEVKE